MCLGRSIGGCKSVRRRLRSESWRWSRDLRSMRRDQRGRHLAFGDRLPAVGFAPSRITVVATYSADAGSVALPAAFPRSGPGRETSLQRSEHPFAGRRQVGEILYAAVRVARREFERVVEVGVEVFVGGPDEFELADALAEQFPSN